MELQEIEGTSAFKGWAGDQEPGRKGQRWGGKPTVEELSLEDYVVGMGGQVLDQGRSEKGLHGLGAGLRGSLAS